MIIDAHVHPAFFQNICPDTDTLARRRAEYGLYKTGIADMEQTLTTMDFGGVDKSILLPLDLTSVEGSPLVSNEEIAAIVAVQPTRFIGFASVDPNRPDAAAVLRHAFETLGLSGLKLHLSRLGLAPDDERVLPLYEICLAYNKPVIFHAGMSWEPNSPSALSRPILFEPVAIRYPALRMCLAHFGWPWVDEVVMLMLKYPNVYTDTALLYMDSPKDFYGQLFTKNMGPLWIERNLATQVMFGSNAPRFRPARLKDGLLSLGFSPATLKKILGGNAIRFINGEDAHG